MSPVCVILLKRHATGEGTRKLPRIEVVEKLSMIVGVDSDRGRVGVVERPADIVVAPQVIDPRGVLGKRVPMAERLHQQVDVSRGQRFPQQSHQCRIVRDLAFLRADVPDDFIGMHDRLGLEQQSGSRDPRRVRLKA